MGMKSPAKKKEIVKRSRPTDAELGKIDSNNGDAGKIISDLTAGHKSIEYEARDIALYDILLGICLPEDFVVRIYANIVQCNIPCFVFNAFMPCSQITDNFSCIAIIGINFAKLCIRRAGTFYNFLLFGGAFHSHIISRFLPVCYMAKTQPVAKAYVKAYEELKMRLEVK